MKILKYIVFTLLIGGMSSCELFNLDFSESHNYVPKESSNEINISTWDFIKSRPDLFSTMIAGIEYAGIQDLYSEPNNTYILLTNNALSNWEANVNCYWNRNLVLAQGDAGGKTVRAGSWEQYDKRQVAEVLRYHILKGEYSYHNLESKANWVQTYGEGAFEYIKNGKTLTGDTAVVDIIVSRDRALPIQLNNYDWNFRGLLGPTAATCQTTNIKATNGYIHVTNYYLERPSRKFLKQE